MTCTMYGQQTDIEYNSDTGANGPHILIKESGDNGNGSGQDGWARMWFKNHSDNTNRWGFLARPHAGATDNDGALTSPLVMAYTGVQKFGFGSDGILRINKQYTLPNMDGNAGEVLTTDGAGVTSWGSPGGIVDGDGDTGISLFETGNDEIRFNLDGGTRFTFDDSFSGVNSAIMNVKADKNLGGFQEARILFEDEPNSIVGGVGYNEASGFRLDIFADDVMQVRGGFNDAGKEARMYMGKFNNGSSGTLFTNNSESPNPYYARATVDVRGDLMAESIEVNEEYTLPTTDGTADQVLTTDGSGNVTWEDAGVASETRTVLSYDLNPSSSEEYINVLGYSYFTDDPSQPGLLYTIPIPTGATLKKVRLIAYDNTNTAKILMRLHKDSTADGTGASISTVASVTSVDNANYKEYVINTSQTATGEVAYFIRIISANGGNNPTTWPGSALRVSKVVMEYDVP